MAAGNSAGFTSVKSGQEINAADTLRLQVPTLLIFSVCGGTEPEQLAVPKLPLPVTLIVPLPSLPVAVRTVVGDPGSLLLIAIIADCGPTMVGVN